MPRHTLNRLGYLALVPLMSSAASLCAASSNTTPLPLGNVSVVAASHPCGKSTCLDVQMRTPETSEPASATLKIGEPPTLPSKGTILFLAGGKGTGYWESAGPDARRVLSELNTAGFRTVQIKWNPSWLIGAEGRNEGPQQLASRAATLADWVRATLHDPSPAAAFCATGNSAGAGQIAYMLVDYGLADELSAVVLTSGPPFTRVDMGCLPPSPVRRPYSYPRSGRQLVDRSFGFSESTPGPCATADETYVARFMASGLAPNHGLYVYPTTVVRFLFGEKDTSSSVPQALLYHDEIAAAGTPFVDFEFIPGTPHSVPSTRQGADRVRDLLLLDCRPR